MRDASSAQLSDLRPPSGGVGGPALGRERHIPAGLAKHAGEGTGPPTQDFDPDVGEELAGGDRRPSLAPAEERRDRHAQGRRQARRQCRDGWSGVGTEDCRDEVAGA